MKKIFKLLLLLTLLTTGAQQANAIVIPKPVYIFGFGASFNDSTVYFTEIQLVDSAWVDARHGFLYQRSTYSYQLRNHLEELGFETPTTCVSFADKRKKIEKKFLKMRKKYTKVPGQYVVKYLSENDFAFEGVSAADDPSVSKVNTKAERKAEKKAERAAQKAKNKGQARPQGGPGGPGGPGGGPGGGGPGGPGGGGGMGGPM